MNPLRTRREHSSDRAAKTGAPFGKKDVRVVELGEQREIVHVRNQDSNVLLQRPEALLNSVDARLASGVASRVAVVVVRPVVVVLVTDNELGLLGLGVVLRAVLE